MNEIMKQETNVFNFEGNNVRTVLLDGEPWFVGKDVAEVLGYSNTNEALKTHCRGVEKRYPIVDSLGRKQEARIINESDMLRLIVKSQLPSAVKFEAWVFEEVLPQIRRTGRYGDVSPQEQMALGLIAAQKLIEQKDEKIEQLENKIEEDKDKVLLAGKLLNLGDKDGRVKPMEFAKAVEGAYHIGRNTLYQIMEDKKIWNSQRVPYARFQQNGMFKVELEPFTNYKTGYKGVNQVVYILPKGMVYLTKMVERLMNDDEMIP